MADYDITQGTTFPATADSADRIAAFLRAAYGWMCAGLAITAVTAWFVASSPSLLQTIARSGPLYLILIIAQLGIVFVLSARVQRLSAATASWLFIGYSVLTGVTLSFIMLVYTGETLTSTFVVAAGMFGAMAAYGTVAKRSLAGWGQFLFMGLIGVVIASIVGHLLAERRPAVRHQLHRRHRLHGAGGLRCAAAEIDGADDVGRPDRFVRHRRRADAVPGFREPVPDAAAAAGRRPPALTSGSACQGRFAASADNWSASFVIASEMSAGEAHRGVVPMRRLGQHRGDGARQPQS